MAYLETKPQKLTTISIKISFDDLVQKIRTGTKRPDILATAENILDRVTDRWNPAIVYRWLLAEPGITKPQKTLLHTDHDNTTIVLDLGHSTCFIQSANYVLIAAYTAGTELEHETMRATDRQDLLSAFILDLIGLLVLEKTGDMVKQIAEQKATDMGWKVSPFLSPGSIHGWDLEEQLQLCSLLPLSEIGIAISKDAVLTPHKSLTCMIGIGPGYSSSTVGNTCQVCSKNESCQMKLPV